MVDQVTGGGKPTGNANDAPAGGGAQSNAQGGPPGTAGKGGGSGGRLNRNRRNGRGGGGASSPPLSNAKSFDGSEDGLKGDIYDCVSPTDADRYTVSTT